MKKPLLLLLLSFSFLAKSQTFTRTFPVTQSSQNYSLGSCAPIASTSDGGYLLNYAYGYPGIHGGPLFSEIIKTDASFVPLWKKELPGSNGIKTFTFNDGSSILFENGSPLNTITFTLEKFNADGETVWRKYGFETHPNKITIQDAFLKDSNTLKLAGVKEINVGQWNDASSQPVLMDFDLDGNYIQGISLSIPSVTFGTIEKICKEASGNYYVIIKSLTSRYIAKFSAANALLWCKNLSFSNYYFYSINSALVLNNGDLLIGGTYNNYNLGLGTLALVRITADGNLVWSKTITNYNTSISSLQELPGNEIMATGTISEDYKPRSLVMKFDGNGNSIWAKKYSSAFTTSELYQKTPNDWYYTAFSFSFTDTYPFLFNTDNAGNTACNTENVTFNLIGNPVSLAPSSLTTSLLTLLPSSTVNTGQSEVQTYNDACLPLSVSDFESNKGCRIFPNPSNGLVHIYANDRIQKITVITLYGQTVTEIKPNTLNSSVTLENSGIYFIQVETAYGTQVFKVIITK